MPNDPVKVEYNEALKPLQSLLAGVGRAGDFFVQGRMEIPLPRVEVAGVGPLSFPVPPSQISAVIQQATRAPYGRGAETVLDESVRKVWQLPPAKISLGGKSWPANFAQLLQKVVTGLACEGLAVRAELYKLLVYDTGGFFLAHRDTEKEGGMFGTLVVCLPSAHRGGELVIRHAGREVTVDLGTAEPSEVTFAAFYADCEHEVRPIAEGNRVCLIYNLVLDRQGTPAESPLAPDYTKEITAVAQLLQTQLVDQPTPAKIAWLLDHQYSPEGLAFRGLKSVDAARVQVLRAAAELAGCAAHLGIVHIEESGAAEPVYHRYRSRRRGFYDEDGDEVTEDDNFEIIEVSDCRHFLNQWRDLADHKVGFGDIPVAPGELLPAGALDKEKPDEQRLMEASGNEGATFERSYHRAALVLWPRARFAEVLLQAGVTAVLPHLKDLIAVARAATAPATARPEAVSLAQKVVAGWRESGRGMGYSYYSQSKPKRAEMLQLLLQLGDADITQSFIGEVVVLEFDGTEIDVLAASAGLLGPARSGPLLAKLLQQNMRHLPGPCLDLLVAVSAKVDLPRQPGWRAAGGKIAAVAVTELENIGKVRPGEPWQPWHSSGRPPAVAPAMVTKLLQILGEVNVVGIRDAAVASLAARPDLFDPVTVLTPALDEIPDWDADIARLWHHAADFLLARSGEPPVPPADWRFEVKLPCACAECRELQAFALNPAEQIHRFRTRQERRSHLQGQIQTHGLDMATTTDTSGSPHTLVCTKDRRSYQRRCEQYRADVAAMAILARLASQHPVADPATLRRLEATRPLAAKWAAKK